MSWLADPVTQAVRQMASQLREEKRDQWENGQFMGQFQFEAAIRNATALGFCHALKDCVVELDYEKLRGELADEERVGPEAPGSRSAG